MPFAAKPLNSSLRPNVEASFAARAVSASAAQRASGRTNTKLAV
jgi:hypothetical protein